MMVFFEKKGRKAQRTQKQKDSIKDIIPEWTERKEKGKYP